MGEDNIAIEGYTVYFDGQQLGYVDGLALAEVPSDTCYIYSPLERIGTHQSHTISLKAEFAEEGKMALWNILFPNWRKKDFWYLYDNYKKKKRIKKR